MAGTMMVVSAPPSRYWKPASQRADWLGALRSPSLRVLYLAMMCAGLPMGAITPLAVQSADRLHDAGLSGTLPAALSEGHCWADSPMARGPGQERQLTNCCVCAADSASAGFRCSSPARPRRPWRRAFGPACSWPPCSARHTCAPPPSHRPDL
ncbi:hypothetical protein GCM10010254_75630 [Streptomyces chromofuscus]|nr:hypothetical protein GCM10010254_75630 [Streptomyces chromofuscus]